MSAVPLPRRRLRPFERARAPHLRVVPTPKRRHTALFVLLYLLIAGATVLGAVSLNAMAAGDAVEARELDAALVENERRYGQLVAEVAELESPERIRAAALELGMVPSDAPRYLVVQRVLPADGAARDAVVDAGETTDPMKPVLSQER